MTKRYPTAEIARTIPEIVSMYSSRKNKKDSFERWYNKFTKLLVMFDEAWSKYVKVTVR